MQPQLQKSVTYSRVGTRACVCVRVCANGLLPANLQPTCNVTIPSFSPLFSPSLGTPCHSLPRSASRGRLHVPLSPPSSYLCIRPHTQRQPGGSCFLRTAPHRHPQGVLNKDQQMLPTCAMGEAVGDASLCSWPHLWHREDCGGKFLKGFGALAPPCRPCLLP